MKVGKVVLVKESVARKKGFSELIIMVKYPLIVSVE